MIFCFQSLEFTACQHPRNSVTSYFQTSSKDFLLSVSLPHYSCPPCLEYLCPRALILLRLRRYINHVLTYLLTYLLIRWRSCLPLRAMSVCLCVVVQSSATTPALTQQSLKSSTSFTGKSTCSVFITRLRLHTSTNVRRTRLVLRWVTLSVFNQPSGWRTLPGHSSVSRWNKLWRWSLPPLQGRNGELCGTNGSYY